MALGGQNLRRTLGVPGQGSVEHMNSGSYLVSSTTQWDVVEDTVSETMLLC